MTSPNDHFQPVPVDVLNQVATSGGGSGMSVVKVDTTDGPVLVALQGTQPVSVVSLPLPDGAATAANQAAALSALQTLHADAQTLHTDSQALGASLGTDGASPPAIAGTGVRGWLRAIYDRLGGPLTVTVTNPQQAATTVTANQGTAGAAPWPVVVTNPIAATTKVQVDNDPTSPFHATIDNTVGNAVPVIVTNPVAAPTSTDVTDRPTRLLGHTTVDAVTAPVTVQNTVPLTVTVTNPVTPLGKVQVDNDPASPFHVTVDSSQVAPVHVEVDNTTPVPVSGTVSIGNTAAQPVPVVVTNPVAAPTSTDVTDRPTRVLGHTTVDAVTAPVTVQNTVPLTVTVTNPTTPTSKVQVDNDPTSPLHVTVDSTQAAPVHTVVDTTVPLQVANTVPLTVTVTNPTAATSTVTAHSDPASPFHTTVDNTAVNPVPVLVTNTGAAPLAVNVLGTQTVTANQGSAGAQAWPVTVSNQPTDYAKDGTDATGVTAPTGGVGIRGWLSGIFKLLSGTLSTSRTWTLNATTDTVATVATGTQTVTGAVTVANTAATAVPVTITNPTAPATVVTANQGAPGAAAWPVTPSNTALTPLYVSQSGALDVSDRAARLLGVASVSGTITQQPAAAYYASDAGGNKLFGSTVGMVAVAGSSALLAVFENPAGSGKTVFLRRVSVGADGSCGIKRSRNAVLVKAAGATSQTVSNRSGKTTPLPSASLYAASAITAQTGATLSKLVFIGTAGGQDTTDEDGTIVLQAGQNLVFEWASTKGNATGNATVELVWWEV